ncbi:MAG: hypothetical protein RIC80_06455 [Cyclobacteriaceae bacterium]
MKVWLAVILLSVNLSVFGQEGTNISSLVDRINNENLGGVCMYVWTIVLKNESKAALELIEIGTSATDELVEALADPEKVIIAHYILSRIWLKEFEITSEIRVSGSIRYYMNDLSFINGSNKFIIDSSELGKCQIYWRFLLNQKGYYKN